MTQRYPLPITPAMLTPANPQATYPRYTSMTDWTGGAVGNDVDVAKATVAIDDAASAAVGTDYAPRTQAAKGALMNPPLVVLGDLGRDYGGYAAGTSRTGAIQPWQPYPSVSSPPVIATVSPNTGPVAGGTTVTLTGSGFTGTTGVTFGGTTAPARNVLDANTMTVTTPAKTAGPYDVVVTTPNGSNPAGSKFTYA